MRLSMVAGLVGFVVGALIPHSSALASAPSCYTYGSSGYCQYDGVVSRAYINSSNLLLIYFDAPVNPAAVSAAGIAGVTVYDACAYLVTQNPDYAKLLFAAALAAQARAATVTLQLWGSASGYLTCDRIWTNS